MSSPELKSLWDAGPDYVNDLVSIKDRDRDKFEGTIGWPGKLHRTDSGVPDRAPCADDSTSSPLSQGDWMDALRGRSTTSDGDGLDFDSLSRTRQFGPSVTDREILFAGSRRAVAPDAFTRVPIVYRSRRGVRRRWTPSEPLIARCDGTGRSAQVQHRQCALRGDGRQACASQCLEARAAMSCRTTTLDHDLFDSFS